MELIAIIKDSDSVRVHLSTGTEFKGRFLLVSEDVYDKSLRSLMVQSRWENSTLIKEGVDNFLVGDTFIDKFLKVSLVDIDKGTSKGFFQKAWSYLH